MKLTFLGTRGNIEPRSRRHTMHSALEVAYRGRGIVVDWGADWRSRQLEELAPRAVVITHAHADHAGGLADGAPCPVWATEAAWKAMERWHIRERRVVRPRARFTVAGIRLEAFPVEHSLLAPAVGYRIEAGRAAIFYAPDLLTIADREAALEGLSAYVGDGASLVRSIVRTRAGARIGHASIAAQIAWCRDARVPRMLITHCGKHIVAGDEPKVAARVRALAQDAGIEIAIAHDAMEIVLR